MNRRPQISALFPYTTLFRSEPARVVEGVSRYDTRNAVLSPAGTLVIRKGELTARLAIRDATGHFVPLTGEDRKSTRLNSSHTVISYAVFCLKKKNPN